MQLTAGWDYVLFCELVDDAELGISLIPTAEAGDISSKSFANSGLLFYLKFLFPLF